MIAEINEFSVFSEILRAMGHWGNEALVAARDKHKAWGMSVWMGPSPACTNYCSDHFF